MFSDQKDITESILGREESFYENLKKKYHKISTIRNKLDEYNDFSYRGLLARYPGRSVKQIDYSLGG